MTTKFYLAAALFTASLCASAAPETSYFPKKDVGQFLATSFDLASIRSSINPRRSAQQRTFADLGLKPTLSDDKTLLFEMAGDWRYEMKILERRDLNRDGIEDLAVCFTDRALNGGTYDTSTLLLITRYTSDSHAVAIHFSIDHPECPKYSR